MLVSLDIETTGFDPIKNNIIEIAIVKFDKRKIIDKYSSLVNPHQYIPSAIKALTNIHEKNLENAPDLSEIKNKITDFIGDLPIVGHNIGFDIEFLNKNGFNFTNTRLDTMPLCQILLPEQKTYSLEILTDKLNLNHKNKHRALDDTIASIDLYNYLADKIKEIKPEIAREITKYLKIANWPHKQFFLDNLKTVIKATPKAKKTKTFQKKKIIKANRHFPSKFSDLGKNIEISEKIFYSLNKGKNLIYESFGCSDKETDYIFPSAFFALLNKKKVVISTKQIKNSYFEKLKNIEIFFLKYKTKRPLKTLILKDKSNYFCHMRFETFKKKSGFDEPEIIFLIKILLWLDKTKTGDKEELILQPKEEFQYYEEINCGDISKNLCSTCNFKDICFLKKVEENTKQADIILVNHQLLINDLSKKENYIPKFENLIIDDSHLLEESATFANTEKIIQKKIEDFNENLIKFFEKLEKKSPKQKKDEEFQSSLFEDTNILKKLNGYKSHFDILLGLIGIFFTKNVDISSYFPKLNLTAFHATTPEWQKIIYASENLYTLGNEIIEDMAKYQDLKEKNYDLLIQINQFKAQNNIIFKVINDSFEDYIKWIIINKNEEILVYKAPLKVKEILSKHILPDKKCVIVTSDTLKIGKNYTHIKKQLDLDVSFEEFDPPLPQNILDNIEIIIPDDIVEPEKEGYFYNTTNTIYDLAIKNKGRLLALFTSKKAIEYTFNKLVSALKDEKIETLGQSVSGGYHKILDKFQNSPDTSIIFSTSNFWENNEKYPELINTLIILKLPFEPPDNPIFVARASQKDNAFKNYSVPKAILKFKQDLNKIIISNKPNTKIYILDKRIISRDYGKLFLESIPDF